jgi:hypothetical protein
VAARTFFFACLRRSAPPLATRNATPTAFHEELRGFAPQDNTDERNAKLQVEIKPASIEANLKWNQLGMSHPALSSSGVHAMQPPAGGQIRVGLAESILRKKLLVIRFREFKYL